MNHALTVKNVPASLMADWLDPEMKSNHMAANPYVLPNAPYLLPNPLDKPAGRVEEGKNQGGKKRDKIFTLPAGVDRIVAIDPQNTLLVYGTDEGTKELQDIIDFLDKPLRKVEIEAQWVVVSREDAKAFGIDYGDAANNPQLPQLGFVRRNFQATLSQLVAGNKAKIITAPRVLAINNLPASTSSFFASDAEIRLKNQGDTLNNLFAGTTQVSTDYTTSFTPTINNDNTVTLKITAAATLKIMAANGTELVPSRPFNGIESIVNLRDGDTIALAGLALNPTATTRTDPKNSFSNLMVFVTARIVRRADDDVKPVALKR